MTDAEKINVLVIICTNVMIYKLIGPGALAYILIGSFFSIGAHPTAMHVIAEHF